MVDTDRNNVRFVATVDSIIVRFHARYCSFHPTEKEYIEICLCLSILWHFWYGKVNYDTSSDNINCESSLFILISSEIYHFLTKSTPCNLRKRTSRRCRISIMRILGWWLCVYCTEIRHSTTGDTLSHYHTLHSLVILYRITTPCTH